MKNTERQVSVGIVDPIEVQRYGMEKATQMAIKRDEDKARSDSQLKSVEAPKA